MTLREGNLGPPQEAHSASARLGRVTGFQERSPPGEGPMRRTDREEKLASKSTQHVGTTGPRDGISRKIPPGEVHRAGKKPHFTERLAHG